mmetsp:Transcript_39759/g.63183  ORF Transcript_39759/g.63183 Transcript_39759/m.63183 type:complete len:169 (-) Transcript_39759:35-541(-)
MVADCIEELFDKFSSLMSTQTLLTRKLEGKLAEMRSDRPNPQDSCTVEALTNAYEHHLAETAWLQRMSLKVHRRCVETVNSNIALALRNVALKQRIRDIVSGDADTTVATASLKNFSEATSQCDDEDFGDSSDSISESSIVARRCSGAAACSDHLESTDKELVYEIVD